MTLIVPQLSRAHKSEPYRPTPKRKRNSESINNASSFEVRPSTNGVGMFATKPISCGDLIIEGERPIVHYCGSTTNSNCSSPPNNIICNACSTVVGSLREHHLMAPPPTDLALPYLDGDDAEGLVFTTAHIGCKRCKEAVWCSDECHEKDGPQHEILCGGSSSLNAFYIAQDSPIIFRLATQSVTLIVSHLVSLSETDRRNPIEKLYFWKDYGSHPLWWTVGSSSARNERKVQAREFCGVLQNSILKSVRGEKIFELGETLVLQICTLENIGSILGMLQCNVMEYEYPSPTQQYIEHVEEIVAHVNEEDQEDHTDKSEPNDSQEEGGMNDIKAGCKWLVDNILNDSPKSKEDNENKEQNKNATMAPIKGSGLFPLLTLANHDCHPNASIDFLHESNQGSMVATRDISVGEEICITYVLNGGMGGGDSSEYFRHFEPTCTWKWLNSKADNDEDDENSLAEHSGADEDNESMEDDDGSAPDDECLENDEQAEEEEEEQLEGSNQRERANALLDYGFECQCERCANEQMKGRSQNKNGG